MADTPVTHTHTVDGMETGVDIEIGNGKMHFHNINGVRTSIAAQGAGHVHSYQGGDTGPPKDPAQSASLDEALARRRAGSNQG